MAVRTNLLCAAVSINGAFTTRYTCPAGRTAILKDVVMTATGAGNTRAVVAVNSGALAVYIIDEAIGAGIRHLKSLWIVLEPGDTIQLFSTGATFNARCSGTELLGLA